LSGPKFWWSESYRRARSGEIPTERHGRLLVVPKKPWDREVKQVKGVDTGRAYCLQAAALVGKDAVVRVPGGVFRHADAEGRPCSMLLKMK
jgi:hypothetical protein